MMISVAIAASAALAACSESGDAEYVQQVDTDADLSVAAPKFAEGTGPRVLIDAAHGNFHTIDGGYAPFAALLSNDGYRVEGSAESFTAAGLEGVDLIVIANPTLPDEGPAFSKEEIGLLHDYVEAGGSLMLIVDHTPFPDAARDLAARFGAEWVDGYMDGPDVFSLRNGGLVHDPVLGDVISVRTFTGSCFRSDVARPLLKMGDKWRVQTVTDTGISDKQPIGDCLQGAIQETGAGRVALFGEAAMFTTQVLLKNGKVSQRFGMHASNAKQNKDFALNIVHWLTDRSEPANNDAG